MASILSLFLSFIFFISSLFARINPSSLSSSHFSISGRQLIKELNLHPNIAVNIFKSKTDSLDDEFKASESRLVKKRLSFPILGESGAIVADLAHHAGYFRLQHTIDARMFYFFLESRKAKADPVVIWLTGGPRCASELALFYENGPFKLSNNLSLIWNDYGWDKVFLFLQVKPYCKAHQGIVKSYLSWHRYNGYIHMSICIQLLQQIFKDIISLTDNINYYDIRKKCEGSLCYDFSNVENFLGESSVKAALGVPSNIDFVSCSDTVYRAMLNDWMRNLEVGIPALLEDNVQLLVYAGEYDLICNWVGNSRWVHAMSWSGQKDFIAASNVSFLVDGKEAGILKNHGPLTFIKVHNAGHMVPMDQPEASLKMLELWTTGKLNPPKKGVVAPL
ncbi:hypothetical protein L1987_25529 [Smallanthus sonchifolius]|uniref:Uncharacterized protein n=1 Tax=Smallanthus sonchifolius TaxID=185202 RepID=A0ACB9IP17_9ASTR|nr:hypothetical protein L1987_25529 [Smallanthus sonchifolius]